MRVTHVLRFDAGLYRGGGEIKAERTREALAQKAVEVQVFTPLVEDLGDLVHFFGSMSYYWAVGQACLQRGIPYVCSPIFVSSRSNQRLRWRAIKGRLSGRVSNHTKLYRQARELFFQTETERSRALSYFGVEQTPNRIIPNGIEARFAEGDADAFRRRHNLQKPFVLQTSVLNPNKHQLELIRASRGMEWDLVLLGRNPNAEYEVACRQAAGPNVHFLGALDHADPLLAGAYAAAEVFCLASSDDIFANSAMEAAVAGTKLVLGDSWGGQEIYGDWAKWVRPGDELQIRKAIQAWRADSHDPDAQRRHFLEKYSWESVANALLGRYEAILAGGG